MELTPELFEKIEFTERRKGYDTEQVETFLEDAGTALAQLLARVRHTEERAAHAEARFSEADARIAAAEERVGEAQAKAQAQVAQAQASVAAARSASALSEEAEVEQAAKTLLMARRTAEAMEQDARGQAQALLGEAKTRADRQLGEAQAEAEELIRRARAQADAEFADRRSRALEEVQALEGRRAQLADVITQLEARLAGYREDLTRTAEELTLLASDPDRLGARPTMSIPPDEVFSPDREPERATVDDITGPTAAAAPVMEEPAPSADEPSAPQQRVVDLDLGGDAGPPTEAYQVEDTSSDSWGPGSWSRVAGAATDVDVESEAEVEQELTVEPEATISLADEPSPSQQVPQIRAEPASGRDRYLKDLDEAVNESGDEDEAMTAFFEGSNDTRNRRFGWRR